MLIPDIQGLLSFSKGGPLTQLGPHLRGLMDSLIHQPLHSPEAVGPMGRILTVTFVSFHVLGEEP
jgi:hypothetical protein